MQVDSTHRSTTFMRWRVALFAMLLGLTAAASIGSPSRGTWHPAVFSMVESWISDVESPVVTEVNLDAVQRNRNQFDHDEVRQDGVWIVYRVPEGGFMRYRVLEHKNNYYRLEFQVNGGGSLTSSSQIGFTLEKREILVNGKPKATHVLRVMSFSR